MQCSLWNCFCKGSLKCKIVCVYDKKESSRSGVNPGDDSFYYVGSNDSRYDFICLPYNRHLCKPGELGSKIASVP